MTFSNVVVFQRVSLEDFFLMYKGGGREGSRATKNGLLLSLHATTFVMQQGGYCMPPRTPMPKRGKHMPLLDFPCAKGALPLWTPHKGLCP